MNVARDIIREPMSFLTRELLAAVLTVGFFALLLWLLERFLRKSLPVRGAPGHGPLPPRRLWEPAERRKRLGERRASAR